MNIQVKLGAVAVMGLRLDEGAALRNYALEAAGARTFKGSLTAFRALLWDAEEIAFGFLGRQYSREVRKACKRAGQTIRKAICSF